MNRNVGSITAILYNSYSGKFVRGNKFFELSNHLGNVLVTVSDKKIGHTSDGTTIDYYNADVITANDYYLFGQQMPSRKYTQPNSSYRYGFNGQEKSDDVTVGNYTAEYWEYDSRTGRRWNLDPIPTVGISDYVTFGDNPIMNVDPDGALFFGAFGSSSKQRQAARNLRDETGGKIRNFYKKNINVESKQWVNEGEFSHSVSKSQDVTRLEGIVLSYSRTYFDKESGEANGNEYYDANLQTWKTVETVKPYKPDFYNNWGNSDNILAKGSYSFVNSFYVTDQNLFTKRFTGNHTTNLNGQATTVKENVESFTSAATVFLPAQKSVKGLTYLEKLNAAQFSKFFKGTAIARAAPVVRGQLNRGANWLSTKYNNFLPSGKAIFPLIKAFKPEQEGE